MRKIAFFIDNSNISKIDLSNPLLGNPGVGGTHYMFVLVADALSRCENNDVYILSPFINMMPHVNLIKCRDLFEAQKIANEESFDFLIVRGPIYDVETKKILSKIDSKVITWSHNFENNKSVGLMNEIPNLACNVCVSKQQLLRLVDTKIFGISTYIRNCVPFTLPKVVVDQSFGVIKICYMGSTDNKRFSPILKIWKKLKSSGIRNIELHVIGGSNLYNSADRIPGNPEISENGIIYHGILGGDEKNNMVRKMDLGVVLSKRETFGLASIEFQSFGVPVIGINSYGVMDTIINGETGFLVNSSRRCMKILKMISKNPEVINLLVKKSPTFIEENFSLKSTVLQWQQLFRNLEKQDKYLNLLQLSSRDLHFRNLLILRVINSKLKLPSLLWYEDTVRLIRDWIRKKK